MEYGNIHSLWKKYEFSAFHRKIRNRRNYKEDDPNYRFRTREILKNETWPDTPTRLPCYRTSEYMSNATFLGRYDNRSTEWTYLIIKNCDSYVLFNTVTIQTYSQHKEVEGIFIT